MQKLDELNQLSEEELQHLLRNKDFFENEGESFTKEFCRYLEENPKMVSMVKEYSRMETFKGIYTNFFESLSDTESLGERQDDTYQNELVRNRMGLESDWIVKFMHILLSYIEMRGKDRGEIFLSAVRKRMRYRIEDIIRLFNESYRKSEQQILYQALHDPLTALPNRNFLESRLLQSIQFARSNGTVFAVCLIDLDDFKPVNDLYGHDAGDLLLKEFSRRIQSCLREGDYVARLGGDEFVLVLEGFYNNEVSEQLDGVLERLHQCVETAFEMNSGMKAKVGISLGCALYPMDGEDGNTLITQADKALNWIKMHKKGRSQWWQIGTNYSLQTENNDGFDSYGAQAVELLNTLQTFLDDFGHEFVKSFYAALVKQPNVTAIISHLNEQEMNSLIRRQAEHLRFLLHPGTSKEMIAERAKFLGQVHVLTGVNFGMLTLSLTLYRNTLYQFITPSIVPAREHYQLLLIIENRLLDDIMVEIQTGEDVIGNYFKVHSRYIGKNIENWSDTVQEEINLLGCLPGIMSAVFIGSNSQGFLSIEHCAGPRAAEVATVLKKLESQNALNINFPHVLSVIESSWYRGEINRSANFQRDQNHPLLLEMAEHTGIRSSIFIPLLDTRNHCIGIIALFGAYFNQFESSWIMQFAHNLQMHWKNS